MTTAEDVHELLDALDAAGVETWIDGGWGVDALVGEQTREHDDLDVVIRRDRVDAALAALAETGFAVEEDWLPVRCSLLDASGRGVDFHPVTFERDGSAWQAAPDGGRFAYPREGFEGRGTIGGRPVRCLSAAVQLLHHQGYEPSGKDRHDVALLREFAARQESQIYDQNR